MGLFLRATSKVVGFHLALTDMAQLSFYSRRRLSSQTGGATGAQPGQGPAMQLARAKHGKTKCAQDWCFTCCVAVHLPSPKCTQHVTRCKAYQMHAPCINAFVSQNACKTHTNCCAIVYCLACPTHIQPAAQFLQRHTTCFKCTCPACVADNVHTNTQCTQHAYRLQFEGSYATNKNVYRMPTKFIKKGACVVCAFYCTPRHVTCIRLYAFGR